ncbi:MAG: hypothetical protein ACC707_19040 [Thiohalomonadales bacterium]
MKNFYKVMVLLSCFLSFDVFSENITIDDESFWGASYYVDGKKIEGWFVRDKLRKIMIANPNSVAELDDAVIYGMTSILLLVSGVIMVTEQIVESASNGDPNATIAIAGGGFIYLGWWVRKLKKEKYKKAIDYFNAGTNKPKGGGLPAPGAAILKSSNTNFRFDFGPQYVSLSLDF